MGHDDPNIGPDHLPGADVGASVTFDSSGHLTQVGVDVPGAAQGSDQATIQFGGDHHDAPQDPGWMPHVNQDAPVNIMDLPPPEGFHWDPITHVAIPNAVDGPYHDASGGAADHSGYGDYPEPTGDTADA